MKKLLAIITSLCLLCTSLVTVIAFADSSKVTVVPAVATKPAEGTTGVTYGGAAEDPTSVVVYDNTLPLELGWGVELKKTTGIGRYVSEYRGFYLDTDASVDDYAGFMTYVKSSGPASDMSFTFALTVQKADGTSIPNMTHLNVDDKAKFLRTDDTAAGWLTTDGGYYETMLPAVEGWLYVDFSSLRGATTLESGDKITQIALWDPGVAGTAVEGSDSQVDASSSITVVASAPVLVEKASVSGGTPVATTIALKGSEPDTPSPAPTPEPIAPELPEYTGDAVAYKDVDVSEIKTPYPAVPLTVGGKPSDKVWFDGNGNLDTAIITGKLAIQQIPMLASHRLTTNDGGSDELIGTYYTKNDVDVALSPIESDKGVAYMFYIEVPDIDEEIPVRLNGAFVRDGKWTNVACYNGTADIMSIAEDTWTTIPISAYYLNLPSGFKGMIRVRYENFGDVEGVLLDGSDGKDYSLASVNFFVANLPGGDEQVVIGAPMVVTNLGNTGRAVYLNGDKTVARDMFTGAPLQSGEVKKSIQKGDFVTELPKGTLDEELTIGGVTSTVVPKWNKLDDGYRYQVELYVKDTQDGKDGYLLQEIVNVYNKDRQQLTGILPGEKYAIVVRAFDANGQLLGIYKPLAVETASTETGDPDGDIPLMPEDPTDVPSGGNADKEDQPAKTGVVDFTLPVTALLLFAAGAIAFLGKQKEN